MPVRGAPEGIDRIGEGNLAAAGSRRLPSKKRLLPVTALERRC
jgi:hypothetical protein